MHSASEGKNLPDLIHRLRREVEVNKRFPQSYGEARWLDLMEEAANALDAQFLAETVSADG